MIYADHCLRVIVRDEQKRFIGPFGIQLHTPYVGEVWLQFTQAIAKIPDLPKECRETVILVVGARTGAKYEN